MGSCREESSRAIRKSRRWRVRRKNSDSLLAAELGLRHGQVITASGRTRSVAVLEPKFAPSVFSDGAVRGVRRRRLFNPLNRPCVWVVVDPHPKLFEIGKLFLTSNHCSKKSEDARKRQNVGHRRQNQSAAIQSRQRQKSEHSGI